MLYNEVEFGKTQKVHIVWFKRDFRVADHLPLWCASEVSFSSDYAVLPLYTFEPAMWHLSDASLRQWRFVQDSLHSLDLQLQRRQAQLHFFIGEITDVLSYIASQCQVVGIWSHQETGNLWTFERDKNVAKWCQSNSVEWHEYPQHAVVRGRLNRDHYQSLMDDFFHGPVLSAPSQINQCAPQRHSDWSQIQLPKWGDDQWIEGERIQAGGREEGVGLLKSFFEHRYERYLQSISKPEPSQQYSSRISPHLAWGTLSVKEVMQAAQRQPKSRGISAFVSRVHWQSHFMQKLETQPSIETHSLLPACDELRPWNEQAQAHLNAWALGQTGVPIIDACMRCLRHTGWLTFRMRAMVVSFATYQLWIPWQQVAPVLARLFTDYEPGIHYSQIQMQSGVTGINQIRIYNPIKQGMDHDPHGHFIKRWCPELRAVSSTWIHQPWLNEALNRPAPIVDIEQSAKLAKEQVFGMRKKTENKALAKQIYQKHGSRKRPTRRRKPKSSNDDSQMGLFE